jgi:hypothetical protein
MVSTPLKLLWRFHATALEVHSARPLHGASPANYRLKFTLTNSVLVMYFEV